MSPCPKALLLCTGTAVLRRAFMHRSNLPGTRYRAVRTIVAVSSIPTASIASISLVPVPQRTPFIAHESLSTRCSMPRSRVPGTHCVRNKLKRFINSHSYVYPTDVRLLLHKYINTCLLVEILVSCCCNFMSYRDLSFRFYDGLLQAIGCWPSNTQYGTRCGESAGLDT